MESNPSFPEMGKAESVTWPNGLARRTRDPSEKAWVTTVSRLITASPICMFAEVQRDYSPIAVGLSSKPSTLYVILVNKAETDDPKHLNPTPWTMIYDGVQDDGAQPGDICR